MENRGRENFWSHPPDLNLKRAATSWKAEIGLRHSGVPELGSRSHPLSLNCSTLSPEISRPPWPDAAFKPTPDTVPVGNLPLPGHIIYDIKTHWKA